MKIFSSLLFSSLLFLANNAKAAENNINVPEYIKNLTPESLKTLDKQKLIGLAKDFDQHCVLNEYSKLKSEEGFEFLKASLIKNLLNKNKSVAELYIDHKTIFIDMLSFVRTNKEAAGISKYIEDNAVPTEIINNIKYLYESDVKKIKKVVEDLLEDQKRSQNIVTMLQNASKE